MTTTTAAATKMTSKEYLASKGWETRANQYAGRCESCGASHGPGEARIARLPGGAWFVVCRATKCSREFVRSMSVGIGDMDDTMGLAGR